MILGVTCRLGMFFGEIQFPLHVFLRRDGSYLCGSYSRQNGTMLIHPCTEELPQLLRLDEHTDAEVVGQIVGVVRRLR